MNENSWFILAYDLLSREVQRHEHSLSQAKKHGAPYEEICNLKTKIYLITKAADELRKIFQEREES